MLWEGSGGKGGGKWGKGGREVGVKGEGSGGKGGGKWGKPTPPVHPLYSGSKIWNAIPENNKQSNSVFETELLCFIFSGMSDAEQKRSVR